MKSNIFTLAAVILLIISCDEAGDPQSTPADQQKPGDGSQSPSGALQRGTFTSYAHSLKGSVALYVDTLDMKAIHLEEFTMTQGPDVRVYISRSNNYSQANTIEIAKLKEAYAHQSIKISLTKYAEEYRFVLIYCLEFHSLFGYAELK